MQDHAAYKLNVEMALANRALPRLPHRREGGHQNVVERGPVRDLLLEFRGAGAQRLIGAMLQLLLERIDGVNARLIGLNAPFVRGTEELAGKRADHTESPSNPVGCRDGILAKPVGSNAPGETSLGRGNTCTFIVWPRLPEFRHISSLIHANAGSCRSGRLCGEIGGGYIVVNWRFRLTRSSDSRPNRTIAKRKRLRDCPPPPVGRAGALSKDRGHDVADIVAEIHVAEIHVAYIVWRSRA